MGTPAGVKQFQNALSGNHLVVKINGMQVGYVQTLTGQDDYAPEPLSGIGDIHIVEWVPSQARYTITVDRMVLRASSLMTVAGGASDTPSGSGGQGSGSGLTNGKGIWEDGYQMMQGFVFDIEALGGGYQIPNQRLDDGSFNQQSSGTDFKHWYGCSFAQGNVRITKHAIVVEDATFYCTQVSGRHVIQ